jgi:hypothetical protein
MLRSTERGVTLAVRAQPGGEENVGQWGLWRGNGGAIEDGGAGSSGRGTG